MKTIFSSIPPPQPTPMVPVPVEETPTIRPPSPDQLIRIDEPPFAEPGHPIREPGYPVKPQQM